MASSRRRRQNRNCNDNEYYEDLCSSFSSFSISTKKQRTVTKPREVCVDNNFMNFNRRDQQGFKYGIDVVSFTNLYSDDEEYEDIEKLFSETNFTIIEILKVYNPYLKKAFEIKRQNQYNTVQPTRLFHGTPCENVDDICTYNFNWRYFGSETGHKFGKGVSFTPCPIYASHYCDKDDGMRSMILADVLICNTYIGNKNMDYPPNGYDTTKKANGKVFVKYNDNEFYPAYVIHLD